MTTVTIPASVERIGARAFAGTNSLKTVIFEGDAPALDAYSYWFDGVSHTAPFSGVDVYYDSRNEWTTSDMNSMASNSRWHDISLINSGTCGEKATWTYTTRKVLTISGSGSLEAYMSGDETPWHQYNDQITTVVVRSGITSISSYAFGNITHLTSVSLPTTLTNISSNAFKGCSELTSIMIPGSVTSVGAENPFSGCNSMMDIYYVGTAEEWQSVENYQSCMEIDANYHFLTLIEATDSTCTEAGHDRYYLFDNTEDAGIYSAAKAPISGIPYKPLLNHTLTAHEEVSATCVDTGIEAYWSCDVCEKMFSDKNGAKEIEEPIVIAVIPHTLTVHDKVEPTCSEPGVEAYWSCNVCGKLFSDKEAAIVIEEPVVSPIDINNHVWDLPVYVWSDDNKEVTASLVCVKDAEHLYKETVMPTSIVTESPTDTTAGLLTYVAEFKDASLSTQKKDVEIPALKDMLVLRLPVRLKTIEEEAFVGNASEAVIIPDNCESIGSKAFAECKNLKYVWIPTSIPKDKIADSAFEGCGEGIILDFEQDHLN